MTDPAQKLLARYSHRPIKPESLATHGDQLPDIALFPITAIPRDRADAWPRFFGDNGVISVVPSPARIAHSS